MLSPKRRAVSSILVSLLGVSLATPLLAAPGLADASAPGLAIEGVDRARLLAPAGARVEPYRATGYALRVDAASGEVIVEIDTSPLGSRSRYRPSDEPPDASDPVARLARSLVAGTRTHYAATSRVLGWIARHVDYELDREAPQDAASVLERRSGYCTGVARLAVALLDAAGLEAREVAGWVADGSAGVAARGAVETGGFHRWIEVHLPDVGWVMSDPLVSHHYVPATYVRLSSETVAPGDGLDGLLLERRDAVVAVDLYPGAPPGVRARRNSDRRLAAALRVAVERGDSGLAVLEGPAVRFRHSLVDGETTFVGLEPGTYQLRLLVAGAALERSVELIGRERTTLFLEPTRRVPASSTSEPRTSAPAPSTILIPNASPKPGDRRDF